MIASNISFHKVYWLIIVRMSPETKALLDQATEQLGLDSFSSYVEEAILEKLQRDRLFPQSSSKA